MFNKKLSLRLVGLTTAFSLVIGGTGVTYASPAAEDPLSQTEIDIINALDIDFQLNDVIHYASEEIGAAYTGGPTERERALYFASLFKEIGLEPWDIATDDGYLQTVKGVSGVQNFISGTIDIAGRRYPAEAPQWNDASKYKGYNQPEVIGETVYFAAVAEAAAAPAEEIKDKIVLTTRNGPSYGDDVRALEAKGAKAVVYFYNKYTITAYGATSSESRFAALRDAGADINIPVVLTSYFDSQKILRSITDADGVVNSVAVTVRNSRNINSQNALAFKPAAKPTDKLVIVGAHYDNVFGSAGANDNLSGVSAVLSIAKALVNTPTDTNIVFALWSGEENGKLGSAYFRDAVIYDYYGVENFKKAAVAYYNLDMLGTSQKNLTRISLMSPYGSSAQPQSNYATDTFLKNADRYWDYSNSKGEWGDWWEKETIVTRRTGSDQTSFAGRTVASDTYSLDIGIPTFSLSWRHPLRYVNFDLAKADDLEYNYHRVGDRYIWTGDQFKVLFSPYDLTNSGAQPSADWVYEEEDYKGEISRERLQILTSVTALAVYDSATASPIAGASGTDRVSIGDPARFSVTLGNFSQALSVAVTFTLGTAGLAPDANAVEAKNGFTALPVDASNGEVIKWTDLGDGLWKGEITLIYLDRNGLTSETPLELFTIERQTNSEASAKFTLNKVTVGVRDSESLKNAELDPALAETAIRFAIWDINRDAKVDQRDLNITLRHYKASSADSDWDTPDQFGYNPDKADINRDGFVDLVDLLDIFLHYTSA
ncbi:MAG: M28 family peptidase [Clostridiales bacterium]|jgi:hypothetical protein|nr:M28 family peptidase [Clostridiales bacterium]